MLFFNTKCWNNYYLHIHGLLLPLIIPNFNYLLTQASHLQDSNWSGVVSIILIEKMYLKIMLSKKSVRMGQSFKLINIFFF